VSINKLAVPPYQPVTNQRDTLSSDGEFDASIVEAVGEQKPIVVANDGRVIANVTICKMYGIEI
jgi:hypothetical protein